MFYFDCNAVVADGRKKGVTIRELIMRMDRLGIQQSLAWSLKAKDYNVLSGNAELIDDINSLDETNKRRLIPVCLANMSLQFEKRRT